MQDPSPELIAQVRRWARGWGYRRGYRGADLEDLEGDALLWLCGYEPPDGFDVVGATLHALIWALRTETRTRARAQRRWYAGPRPRFEDLVYRDPGYDEVDLELLLDGLPRCEREACLACLTPGDSEALARRDGVTSGAITRRRGRARARLLESFAA